MVSSFLRNAPSTLVRNSKTEEECTTHALVAVDGGVGGIALASHYKLYVQNMICNPTVDCIWM